MSGQKLTNTTGTSNYSFSIHDMVIEYINEGGPDDGARLRFPGLSPVYIRALDPQVATKWINSTNAPTELDGNNGDYHLNSATGDISFKQNHVWSVVASLVGPAGGIGPTGPQGPIGPTGPVGPSAAISTASDVSFSPLENGDLITWNSTQQVFVNIRKENVIDGGNI